MALEGESYRNRVSAVMNQAGRLLVAGGYPILAASAFLPILVEHLTNPAGAYSVLVSMVGEIGGELIANIAQGAYEKARSGSREYDVAEVAAILDRQMQASEQVSRAIAVLVRESDALSEVSQTLESLTEEWDAFAEKLLNQVRSLPGTQVIIDGLRVERLTIVAAPPMPAAKTLLEEYLRRVVTRTDQREKGGSDASVFQGSVPLVVRRRDLFVVDAFVRHSQHPQCRR